MKLNEVYKIEKLNVGRYYFTVFIEHKFNSRTENVIPVCVVSILTNVKGVKYIRSDQGNMNFSNYRWFGSVPLKFNQLLIENKEKQ